MTTPPLDIVRAYHQRTKHRFDGYAQGPETLDWDDQPAAFRHFAGAPTVALPGLAALDAELAALIARPFGAIASPVPAAPPGMASLAALLQLALGVTAWKSYGPSRWAVRANPSSGNLHPVEAYVVVSGLAGLADGVYHYRPDDHALELRAEFAPAADAAEPSHSAHSARSPAIHVALTTVMWREAWKYGERAFRYCQLDTGHAVAALAYAAALLGWQVIERRQPGSAGLAHLVGVDRSGDFPASRNDTGREEAEILLAIGPQVGTMVGAALLGRSDGARWHGRASVIDAHPLYRWPVVDEVALATRRSDGAPAIPVAATAPALPEPADLAPSPPAGEVILGRRSAQRFDSTQTMALADFVALMDALLPRPRAPWGALAGGATAPHIALVLFVHRVDGLAPGIYLLPRSPRLAGLVKARLDSRFALSEVAGVPEHLGLTLLETADPAPLHRLARALHCHQDLAANACFALGMLAEFAPLLAEDPAAYRDLYREAGLIGQVLYLAAESRGYAGTGIGCFFDDPVHELLGLQGEELQTLYHFTVGRAIHDPRIETTLPYLEPGKTMSQAAPATDSHSGASARPGIRRISAADAAALIRRHRDAPPPGLALYDVRNPASFARGHVDGALHLDEGKAGAAIMGLPKTTPVLIYCERGNASQTFGQMFADFRFTEVYSVDGGFAPLQAALMTEPERTQAPAAIGGALAEFFAAYDFDPADLNAPRQHGLTPLMRAALLGRNELVAELLALGVDIELRNHDGNNALWLACVSNNGAVVQRLIAAGIPLDNRNDAGATCLMYGASSGRPAMIELLLAAGADPLIRDQDDARAVDLCSAIECLKLLRHTAG